MDLNYKGIKTWFEWKGVLLYILCSLLPLAREVIFYFLSSFSFSFSFLLVVTIFVQ
jgi:hypothetical protein